MNIQRGELLAKLNEASPGLSPKGKLTVEQSDCYVFQGDTLTTFNDSIMVRVPNPLGFDVVVKASDLLDFVTKMPDDEITITLQTDELRIKGAGRTAGITAYAEVAMPMDAVPKPETWTRLGEGTPTALQQAAKTCARKDSDYLLTAVHVTKDWVEGCDGLRYIRITGPTGFPNRVLMPADAVLELEGLELAKVAIGEGWVHFRTAQKATVSVRCGHSPYIEDVEKLLDLKKPEKIILPSNLGEIVERAQVFDHGGDDFKIGVRLSEGKLLITARKDGAWLKEKKEIEYEGRTLAFDVNPELLVEVLGHTREVLVDGTKLKIGWDRNQFVVCLDAKEEDAQEDQMEAVAFRANGYSKTKQPLSKITHAKESEEE